MRYLLFCCAIPLFATTALVRPVDVTPQQAIIVLKTDQVGAGTMKVSTVNDFSGAYVPVNDVNTSIFTGSDAFSRTGNINSGSQWTLVIGKRSAELGTSTTCRTSRSLQVNTLYYYQLAIGSDTLTGSFITGNYPAGNTQNDLRYDINRPGEYAYPCIDWTSSGKTKVYIDPTTGFGIQRVTGPGEVFPQVTTGRTFTTPTGGSGWSGSTWTGTGVGSYLRLRATVPSPIFTVYDSIDAAQPVLTLSGTAPSAEICMSNDGVTCAGASITQAITVTPTIYTIGANTPILGAWRNSTNIPSTYIDIQSATGDVTKSGTAITWVDGRYFDLTWGTGSIITLGSTDCAIASVTNEKALVLSSSGCIADGSYAYTGNNWGFLVRSTGTGTLTVASPTWTSTLTGSIQGSASGIPKLCSPVKVADTRGVMGQVCSGAGTYSAYSSANMIFWVGDDGTVNLIAPSFANPGSSGLGNANCAGEGLNWDPVVAGKYYCLFGAPGSQVLYSIRYTGDYSAVASIPLDGVQASADVNVLSTDIDTLVTSFTASDPVPYSGFTSSNSWGTVGIQNGKILIYKRTAGQDSVGWTAVMDPATGAVTAAMSTYGGASLATNRWCGNHTPNIGGDSEWNFMSCNPTQPAYTVGISSGTLTSTFSTCPTNTVVPALTGQTQCSTVTLASLTPLNPSSASLYGQTLLLGDEGIVLSNGDPDHEIVRILTLSGLVAVVQRNARPNQDQFNNKLNHTGTLGLYASPNTWHEMWWGFVLDAHGQTIPETYGATVMADPDSGNCHEVFENDVFILGCLNNSNIVANKVLRLGQVPTPTFTNAPFSVNPDATFNGSIFVCGANYCEQHPSIGQRIASAYEKPIWTDNRPYAGDPTTTDIGCVSQVSGNLYKVAASCTTALNYQLQGIVGLAGTMIMADVSPTVIANVGGDAFKFCYTVIAASDCNASSSAGEIYFNIPQLTSTSVVISRFFDYPFNLIRDVTFTQNTFTHANMAQGKALYVDPSGTTIRRMSTAFAAEKLQTAYWNNMSLPDNKWNFWVTNQTEYARSETFILKLPPWPGTQSTNRGQFIQIPVKVPGVSGDTIRIRFGYAENGAPTNYYCTQRQVGCATDGSGASPFLWTDQTQSYKSCSSGCTLTIPAISGRTLYYVIDRKNGASTVTSNPVAIKVD